MSRAPDGCLVPTGPLAEILRGFLAKWERDRPTVAGRGASRESDGRFSSSASVEAVPLRGVEWLAAESGISESTIQNIVDQRYRGTELRIAEALVVGALERPDLFDEDTLFVYPNPSASAQARAECCSGSTTPAEPPASMLSQILSANLPAANSSATGLVAADARG